MAFTRHLDLMTVEPYVFEDPIPSVIKGTRGAKGPPDIDKTFRPSVAMFRNH